MGSKREFMIIWRGEQAGGASGAGFDERKSGLETVTVRPGCSKTAGRNDNKKNTTTLPDFALDEFWNIYRWSYLAKK